MESTGRSPEERRKGVELRIKTDCALLLPPPIRKAASSHSGIAATERLSPRVQESGSVADKSTAFSASPSEDSGFEGFAHSPNSSTFSYD